MERDDTRENLSGLETEEQEYKTRQWVNEMHAIAVGIETEGEAWKERMSKLESKND